MRAVHGEDIDDLGPQACDQLRAAARRPQDAFGVPVRRDRPAGGYDDETRHAAIMA